MAPFLQDTFAEASGSPTLDLHTGETGATWVKHPNAGAGTFVVPSAIDRCRSSGTGSTKYYYASGTPASADYDVEGTFFFLTAVQTIGVIGRVDTAAATYYALIYDGPNARWELLKAVAGAITSLGTFSQTLVASTSYVGKLEMVGTAIKAYIDGVQQISVTDSAITAAGKAGARTTGSATTDSTGTHLDSITATDVAAGATLERAASLEATGAIVAAGEFFSVFERSAAITATGAVATTGQRDLQRSAAIAATGTVTAAGTFWTEFARSAALSAVSDVTAAGQIESGAATHERSATISATTGVAAAAQFWSTVERAVTVTAATGVASTGTLVAQRAAVFLAASTVNATGQRDLLRTAALTAATSITASGTAAPLIVPVGRLEAGLAVSVTEGGAAAAVTESSSGVLALIE